LTFFYLGLDDMTPMTTQAPLITPEPTAEQITAPLDARDTEPILDALALLDHRTRQRAIGRRLAPFGHYLAFEQDGEEWLVPIDSNVTHIGRGLTADVRVEEQRVSRSHAILVRHGHHTRLLDNRSANGTFVNGRRVVATNIVDGDVIRIGPVVMTYLQIA
jgi:pSer/pThr/pTyr-binding forkhead associated (FHA) protein